MNTVDDGGLRIVPTPPDVMENVVLPRRRRRAMRRHVIDGGADPTAGPQVPRPTLTVIDGGPRHDRTGGRNDG